MIIGFEKETAELTVKEMEIAETWSRAFIARFRKSGGKPAPLSATVIAQMYESRTGEKMGGARTRKIINYIRTTGMVPNLLANSQGYWISRDEGEINAYICSLDQRIRAIEQVREALIRQNREPETKTQLTLEL